MKKGGTTLLLVLFFSGLYLYAFPTATLHYGAIILLHLGAGALLILRLVVRLRATLRPQSLQARWGWGLLTIGAGLGMVLIFTGATRPYQPWLYAHMVLSLSGLLVLAAAWLQTREGIRWNATFVHTFLLLVAAVLGASSWAVRELRWQHNYIIQNPALPPAAMEEEGDGHEGPFFPSSAQTAHGGLIPARFFLQPEACQRCHSDIYESWQSSAHHFSSFNNQWYRKSVEYMQEVVGTQPSKWCGGCHDPALLFTGMMDTPIAEIVDRPEAHAGLDCVSCHSIVAVKSTMGQGDYILEYPRLHELATSDSPVVRFLHDFLVQVNPEPHRRTFMKPFMRRQSAEFCSACHKVHLDQPVNHYRWTRGFDEYDNWQASGFSGQGARSFYYPAQPQTCVDCHMPLVPSNDDGNVQGFVHSHRFPGANTALPVANQDAAQFERTKRFLSDGIVSVDIFALSVSPTPEQGIAALLPGATPVFAPLDRVEARVRPGESVRVDVVVRNRKVAHSFPGGTTDAFDLWLELVATGADGQVLFWSGRVEDDGKGQVEKGAHFYRSLGVDGHGNPINKRNAWAARAVVYSRSIPPGSADIVHYRLHIPERARGEITLTARLKYRKFAWWFTQFSYAGVRDPAQADPEVTPHYDDGGWVFTGDTSKVSGKLKHIPDLPIVTLAEDEVSLRVLPADTEQPSPQVRLDARDWERWNDYGIGLLGQGDLTNAEAAFKRTTEINPKRPEGWVNIAQARIADGDYEGAQKVLEQALALDGELARARFLYAQVLRADGRLEDALTHLKQVAAQYPRDRVVHNEMGRLLFLQGNYAEAIQEFEQVLSVDPEDLQAHYNLMLCYTALGQEEPARQHRERYLRFKPDELASSLLGPYLRTHPEDNNERQPIHEHASVRLAPMTRPSRAD